MCNWACRGYGKFLETDQRAAGSGHLRPYDATAASDYCLAATTVIGAGPNRLSPDRHAADQNPNLHASGGSGPPPIGLNDSQT